MTETRAPKRAMRHRAQPWRSRIFTAGLIACSLSWLALAVDIGFTLCYDAHASLLLAALSDPWQRIVLLCWSCGIVIALHAED